MTPPSADELRELEDLDPQEAIATLWRAGILSWKLWAQQVPIYDRLRSLPRDVDEAVLLCARQFGKCVVKNSMICTPHGPIAVQDIEVGAEIYGYNADGSVGICRVVAKECQGIKRVIALVSHGRTVAKVTAEHRFLSRWKDGKTLPEREMLLTTDQITGNTRRKIARVLIDAPLGDIHCDHAYVIGAMIGNGCRKEVGNRWWISSPDDRVPRRVGEIIGAMAYRSHESNFNYGLTTVEPLSGKHSVKVPIEHQEWFEHHLSRDKYIDRAVVQLWDRESCLALLAGLTDTDGTVVLQKDGTLRWAYSTGSEQLANDVQWLVHRLFQRSPGLTESFRRSSSEFLLQISNNLYAARIVKAISPFMVMEHKRWRPEFEQLRTNNSSPDRIGLKAGAINHEEVWDIQVDNETSLYVMHDEGLITHNSHLGVLYQLENALRWEDRCFLIMGPTLKQTREIVAPRLRRIAAEAPKGLVRPSKSEGKWYVGSSEIVMGGFDMNSSGQRGKTVQETTIEEIVDSNPDDYTESLRSDIGPAMTHSDAGKTVFLTTLPKIPDHPFITETMVQAQLNGSFYSFDIYANKHLTKAQFDACVRRAGGMDTDAWKREYLNKIIRERSIVCIPDFDAPHDVEDFVVPNTIAWEVYLDWGGVRDFTVAVVVGHSYLMAQDLCVDEQWWPANTPTDKIVDDLRVAGGLLDTYKPRRVVADVQGQIMVDLTSKQFNVELPSKTDWESNLNNLANRFTQRRMRLHPRCKLTIQTCQSGLLNKQRTDFERTKALGHCDAIAALMYANRGLDRTNPYPAQILPTTHFKRPEPPKQGLQAILPEAKRFAPAKRKF